MIEKVKKFLDTYKQKLMRKKKLDKAQEYYKILQSGALFLKFIRQDMERMKKQNYNRNQRRRFEKQIAQKGEFSNEIIEHYSKQVDIVLANIQKEKDKK